MACLYCLIAQCMFYMVTSQEDSLYNLNEIDDAMMQYTYEAVSSNHHRSRRATEEFAGNVTYTCNTDILPQPTAEYPAVLFEGVNYNNCTADKRYKRLRINEFVKWGENLPGRTRGRKLKWWSMLVLPGVNVTFRACCPSGNQFVKTVSSWSNSANLNLSVFYHTELQGNDGVWYKRWLHWVMNFDLRLKPPVDYSSIPDCGVCYFGQCGLTGKCECASGYSGDKCQTRPTSDMYPTQAKPLVLFTETYFQGSYITANPELFKKFSGNIHFAREMVYKSMRILYNHTLVFSRNIVFTTSWGPGSDIEDIAGFMISNPDVANPIWYNYDRSIEVNFYVKVVENTRCDNCSITGGVCYTGECVCMPTFTGVNCDNK